MNHEHEVQIDGASLDASIILRQVLAGMIAGVTTEVTQTNDAQEIAVNVIAMDTGLKFTFVLPSATAVAGVLTADIVMSAVSANPVQNRVIKAYVDGKFWTGTAAEYALLEDDTDIICFLSDTNVIMYNGESYSLNAHAHGNITNAGAIGELAGLVLMTGTDGVVETVTVADLKELLGASSGMNFLHNAEFASPFNTAGLTIYNTAGECLDRWNLLGGTLTINNDYATLSQAAINTAQLRQHLPAGTYDRLMGQTLTLSVLLAEDPTIYSGSGVIDGVAETIMTFALDNGYLARLIVNNTTRVAYVEINGGGTVGAIDLSRVKLEIGSSASIEDGVTDAAFDWARIKLYDLAGVPRAEGAYVRYDAAMALTAEEKARVRTSIGAPATAADVGAVSYAGATALNDTQKATARTNIGAVSSEQITAINTALANKADLVDGRLIEAQAVTKVVFKNGSFMLSANEVGAFIRAYSGGGAITVIVPRDTTYKAPIGATFVIMRETANTVTIAGESGVGLGALNGVLSISSQWGCAVLTKLFDDDGTGVGSGWHVTCE